MTDPHEKLTTDPPRPPGTPDVDDLVGDPTAGAGSDDPRVAAESTADAVSVEPPD